MSRRALLVGINGFAPRDIRSDVPELKGCVNDAELMARHLKEDFGFPESEIRILRDGEARGEDVRRELGWLLSDYDDDGSDVRVFHISTHGTQVRVEPGGDEAEEDGLDEAFVVHDHEWGEPFRDNEIRGLFAKVPENVSVIFQADCCHSGNISSVISIDLDWPEPAGNELAGLSGAATLARMRALHRTQRRDELEIASQPTGSPSPWPEEISIDTFGETRRVLNPEAPAFHDDLKTKDFRIVGSEARHILISACEDAQESKEFRTREGFHGGLTWAISKTIEERKRENRGNATQLTYKGLIEEVGRHLRFSAQTPLLEGREDALDTPLFSASGGRSRDNDGPSEQGDHSNMTEQEQTSADQLILFLMNYAGSPKKFKSQGARLELMKDCGLHPKLIEAMKTRDFDNIAQALSGFAKPIGDEGGGRPIGDEGGSRR